MYHLCHDVQLQSKVGKRKVRWELMHAFKARTFSDFVFSQSCYVDCMTLHDIFLFLVASFDGPMPVLVTCQYLFHWRIKFVPFVRLNII